MKTITIKTKLVPVNQRSTIIRGRIFLSKKYRDTKEEMKWEIASQWKGVVRKGPITLNILLYFGDKRKRDFDNYLKILLDSMAEIVYEDDSQIVEAHIFKEIDKKNPRTEVQVVD